MGKQYLGLIAILAATGCTILFLATVRRKQTRLHRISRHQGEPSPSPATLRGESAVAYGFTVASMYEAVGLAMLGLYAVSWYPKTVFRAEPDRLRMHRVGQFVYVEPGSYLELHREQVTSVHEEEILLGLRAGRALLKRYTIGVRAVGEFSLALVWRDPGPNFGFVSPLGATREGAVAVDAWLQDVARGLANGGRN